MKFYLNYILLFNHLYSKVEYGGSHVYQSYLYQAVGVETKKVYIQGTRADCLRFLQNKYPYEIGKSKHYHRKIMATVVLPEAIQLLRR